MCKRLRESQQRESALIVENNEQARLLGMSAERECDLRGKIERLERKNIHTCHDRCQNPMCVLRRERDAERALADRLAGAANVVIDQWETPNWKLTEPTATCMNTLRNTLAAWKEARGE